MRLSPQTLDRVPLFVERPFYAREEQACGIVHIGIGAFHRAHQALYTDSAMNAGERGWAITGVSLRSRDVHDSMTPQGNLYTVSERAGTTTSVRVVGAVRRVLVAQREPLAVIAAIAARDTHIVTFTVTEKGYLPGSEGTIYDYLGRALAQRKAAGMSGLTLLSCDNLPSNGAHLAAMLGAHLDRSDPDLARWFRDECACPSSMVDRIVPATTEEDRAVICSAIGLRDEAAVITEPFHQWVIEDRFAGLRPRWETVGVQIVADVRPYETAKLRMLNGAHSALAYLGLARGHEFVHQAIADPALARLIERLMRLEAAPSLPASDLDLHAYAAALIARFANRSLQHRLAQIAMDGSQKIPQRWLETLQWHQSVGDHCPAILQALAAWITFVRGDGHRVDDPQADQLAAIWREEGRDGVVAALFGENGHFARWWICSAQDAATLTQLL